MKALILGEVLTLEEAMHNLYDELVTMHKEFVHLHALQQQCKYFVKTLRNVQDAITVVHGCSMQHQGAPLDLGKGMKQQEELEKERVWMLIQKNI